MDIHKIIADYLSGSLTKEGKEQLDKWLDEDPSHPYQFETLKKIWQSPIGDLDSRSMETERLKIWNRLTAEKGTGKKKQVFIGKPSYLRYAAMLIILFGAAFVFWNYLALDHQPQKVTLREIIKNNPPGQKSKIGLPDGSTVWLNAESKLSYFSDFNQSDRTILLEGEAFFDVAKDPEKPFKVHTKNLVVTALGTSFNVHAYHGKDFENIALKSGKVKVENRTTISPKPQYLSPGELAHFENTNNSIEVSKISEADPFGWKDGRISFHHATINEVTEVLSRWYNVRFQVIGKPQKEWDYNATFENEVLENILENLKFSKKINYQIDKQEVVISFQTD